MRRRFAEIRRQIVQTIDRADALGLRESKPISAKTLLGNVDWKFETDAQKIKLFREWLKEQVDSGLMSVDGNSQEPWTSPYVRSAYLEGTSKAYTSAKGTDLADNYDLFEQGRQQFLQQSFTASAATSKLQLIATRSFTGLQGITQAMDTQLSTILATGIAEGRGPKELARQMTQSIDKLQRTRAETLARTELAYAHSEGQLDGFDKLGIDEITAFVEWSTAGDEKVCKVCQPLQGVVLKVKEARGLLPRHPNCRCSWIPANVGEKVTPDQKFSKQSVKDATLISIRRETGLSTGISARGKSTWTGKNLSPTDKKPRPPVPVGGKTAGKVDDLGGTTRKKAGKRPISPPIEPAEPPRGKRAKKKAIEAPAGTPPKFKDVESALAYAKQMGVEQIVGPRGEAVPLHLAQEIASGAHYVKQAGMKVPRTVEWGEEAFLRAGMRKNELTGVQGLYNPRRKDSIILSRDAGRYDPHVARDTQRKWAPVKGRGYVFVHEAGHLNHWTNAGELGKQMWTADRVRHGILSKAVSTEVSKYATTNRLELVAETFAAKVMLKGKKFSDALEALYAECGGPKL